MIAIAGGIVARFVRPNLMAFGRVVDREQAQLSAIKSALRFPELLAVQVTSS